MDPHSNNVTTLDMQLHSTPQQTFEKDPQIFISPVSILPPSAAAPTQEEPPHLTLTSARPSAAAEHARRALMYVKARETESWAILESLARHRSNNPTPYDRLKASMEAGRNSSSSRTMEAYRNVERALGKWAVHEHHYIGGEYSPAAAEADVMARCAGGGRGVQEEFERNITAFAKREKGTYKKELDARKDALEGVLSSEHAKLVNNQKSAHLSKFMSLVSSRAKDHMIAWLLEAKYGAGNNYSYFEQHIAM